MGRIKQYAPNKVSHFKFNVGEAATDELGSKGFSNKTNPTKFGAKILFKEKLAELFNHLS